MLKILIKVEESHHLILKLTVHVINRVSYWHKDRLLEQNSFPTKNDTKILYKNTNYQLISYKGAKAIQWRR